VVWSGDKGQLALDCNHVFNENKRAVHIPNAIQINISAKNNAGENIIPNHYFGEYLQQCFLATSRNCCLLYMPEEDAFERLVLKSKYGLANELCSPNDISGGHQGSIALYKKWGKHNQKMGLKPLVVDQHNQPLIEQHQWHETARVEHRLGASSIHYNPYINVVYTLANLIDALKIYTIGECKQQLNGQTVSEKLPKSLFSELDNLGAIDLFKQEQWFSSNINQLVKSAKSSEIRVADTMPDNTGDVIKHSFLAYLPKKTLVIDPDK
jgi:hypothetical protein